MHATSYLMSPPGLNLQYRCLYDVMLQQGKQVRLIYGHKLLLLKAPIHCVCSSSKTRTYHSHQNVLYALHIGSCQEVILALPAAAGDSVVID